MEKTVQQAFDEYCNLLYQALLSNCPVDTGNMLTHIRMDNDGMTCKITIDTVPYQKAPKALQRRIKKYGKKSASRQVEYAAYTEYPWLTRKGKNPNQGWVRRDSILHSANIVGDVVNCLIEVE